MINLNPSNIRFQALYLTETKPDVLGLALLENGKLVRVFGRDKPQPGGTALFTLTVTSVAIEDDQK